MALPYELKNKTKQELREMLVSLKEELHELKVKVVTREFKNVRRIRIVRKKIAHLMTLLNEKK